MNIIRKLYFRKKFKSKNIFDKLCFVSDKILKEGYKVGLMYREELMDEIPDSGWRFLAGNEDDEYMDTPYKHHIVEVKTVCEVDPDIIPYINSEIGNFYVRVDKKNFDLDDETKPIFFSKWNE